MIARQRCMRFSTIKMSKKMEIKTPKKGETKRAKKKILIAFGYSEQDARNKMARAKNTPKL